jgi:hypothetical protein
MTSATQNTLIDRLAAEFEGFRRNKFAKALCALEIIKMKAQREERNDPKREVDEDGEPIEIDFDLTEETRELASVVRPNGYVIDWKSQMITVFEVEVTSKLTEQKIEDYYRIYCEAIDPLGWGLALIVVNSWGARSALDYLKIAPGRRHVSEELADGGNEGGVRSRIPIRPRNGAVQGRQAPRDAGGAGQAGPPRHETGDVDGGLRPGRVREADALQEARAIRRAG